MIISEYWLREWVDFDLDFASLPEKLTAAGLETGVVEDVRPIPESVISGRIEEVATHPDADGLTLCQVDIGTAAMHQVVCGAPNLRVGMIAPFAGAGTCLPTGQKIKKAAIRGQLSAGMLCSAAELGLEEQSSGILALDPELGVGNSLNAHLQLPDRLLEVELTPNRGDCLSVLGVAREVAALTGGSLVEPGVPRIRAAGPEPRTIVLDDSGACARYAGRTISRVLPGVRTPDLIRERLRRAGLRSIDALVDITNYVMLELGQPLHAFDNDRLQGDIHVRPAKPRERLTLLDGERVTLDSEALVITDRSGAVALAGIKGGESTMIHSGTKAIFLEAAFFNPEGVARTARQYTLNTDASHRFERGVDFMLPAKAIDRASALILSVCGGTCGPRIESVDKKYLPKRRRVALRASRLKRMLGVKIHARRVHAVFSSLGMDCQSTAGGWRVKPPSHRFDITAEHDLVEEVARIIGYDHFPLNRPRVVAGRALAPEGVRPLERAKDFLVDKGYREAITYSFVSPQLQKRIRGRQAAVKLKNPISVHLAEMRVSLLPGLLEALANNARRQVRDVRLFETGHVFLKKDGQIREDQWLGGVVMGSTLAASWDQGSREIDFFDVKGDVEGLISAGEAASRAVFAPGSHPAYQAGQYAQISASGRKIGRLGRISETLLADLDINGPVFGFELDWERINQKNVPQHCAASRYPAVSRDISLVITKETSADAVRKCIESTAPELMVALDLVDVYQDAAIGDERKSVTYRLTLQSNYRNLTDEEADRVVETVLGKIKADLEGELRSL